MAQRGWSRIVKESSGDRDYFLALVKAVSESETTVLQGNEPDIAWGLSVGAKGLVPACGNYVPSLFCTAWRTHQAGDEASLVALQKQIMAIRETLLMGDKSWLAGAMYGVHTLGIGSGIVPRPIPELSAEQKREIDVLTESDVVLQLTDG
jgi:dihydrodipicolinate synthase/N-acetylneuraminate lyase